MIKCIIIDDEYHSRENLKQMLKLCCPDVQVIDEADRVAAGIEAIRRGNPDLVFLDIRMPDGSGFDILQKLGEVNFKVVFVTAYEEYAIKAFKFSAIDYILKPIDPDELKEAVGKAVTYFKGFSANDAVKQLLDTITQPHQPHKKIVLKTINTLHLIEIDKIIRCESDRNYTIFYIDGEEKIVISRSMKDFEEMLQEHNFLRVHNSHLININYIRKFHKDELLCVLSDNTSIPVAYRKKDELLNLIKNL
ncbi:MAG TPA: LytTR family DNA-binding domain-containing protein [Lentimicrobium sp.]|nr:LytTR family DNA-binding domain-containing protein [Lentimicrobium sp.]